MKGKEGHALPPSSESIKSNEYLTARQLLNLFRDLTTQVSCSFAYLWHCQGKLRPEVKTPLQEEHFEKLFKAARSAFDQFRRGQVMRRRRTRKDYSRLNLGFKEEEEHYEATQEEFENSWRDKSIVEDCWKAEYYQQLTRKVRSDIPDRGATTTRSDRVSDVLAAALRSHITEQNRPVLTHELADYENPYMMKRSALERLAHECCVRNKLDERCLPRLLDRQPDLVKLRAKAALPPEVIEPLAAFRGDTRWHFDSRERLSQKLSAVDSALSVVSSGGDMAAVVAALPENAEVQADQVMGVHHPWRNHLGFESAVPHGITGGLRFGQPAPALETQLRKLRYPTLQRVAHTLPADPKWRAHVVRSIRLLERSKHWDYQSKLTAINKMKEVYDTLKPSVVYTRGLDERMPINRVPGNLTRKYARDANYVKRYPKNFKIIKSMTRYRSSLTAKNPLPSKDRKKK